MSSFLFSFEVVVSDIKGSNMSFSEYLVFSAVYLK